MKLKSQILTTLVLFCAFVTSSAFAGQYKTVTSKLSLSNYEYEVSYPAFFAGSIPGYEKINAALKETIADSGCDVNDIPVDRSYDYGATGKVIALNKHYVGVQVSVNSDCGGVHPNYSELFYTYDSETGEALNIENEFGFVSYDDPKYDPAKDDARRLKVAKILAKYAKKGDGEGCFDDMTEKQKIEEISTMYPTIGGLAKDKKVVVTVQPAHVAMACWFEVRVDLAVVKSLLNPASYLNTWLK